MPACTRLRGVLVGDGPQRRSVERALRRREMMSWVELPGQLSRDEIRALYRGADLYLAPAVMESFGIAALEARCAGLPVVSMNRGGTREFIRDGIEGHLAGSDADMADIAAQLLSTPERLDALRLHNSTTVPTMSWDHTVDRTLSSYHHDEEPVLRGRTGQPPIDG